MVVANAYISDVYKPKERGPKFAQLGATMMLALLIGPLSGAGLVNLFNNLRAPLFAATVLCAVSLGFAHHYILEPKDLFLKTHESESSQALIPKEKSADEDFVELGDVKPGEKEAQEPQKVDGYNPWKSKFNLAIGIQTFMTNTAFNGITSCLAILFMEEKYGFIKKDGSVDDGRLALQVGLNTIIISLCAM